MSLERLIKDWKWKLSSCSQAFLHITFIVHKIFHCSILHNNWERSGCFELAPCSSSGVIQRPRLLQTGHSLMLLVAKVTISAFVKGFLFEIDLGILGLLVTWIRLWLNRNFLGGIILLKKCHHAQIRGRTLHLLLKIMWYKQKLQSSYLMNLMLRASYQVIHTFSLQAFVHSRHQRAGWPQP